MVEDEDEMGIVGEPLKGYILKISFLKTTLVDLQNPPSG